MINFTNTVTIGRPIADVFSYLSDLEHIPEWNWAIADTKKITPGPIAVGTRFRQARTIPRPATEMLEITQLDPYRRVEIRGILAEMPTRLRYVLEEDGSDTVVTNVVSLNAGNRARMLAPFLGRRISQAVASNLNDLKTRLETRPTRQQERNERS